jgi:hypothetical protein
LSRTRIHLFKMSGHDGKSRVPTFDGKQENYEEFEMQWNAFAHVEVFADALLPKGHPYIPSDHKTTCPDEGQGQGEGKKQARAKKENSKAVAYGLLHVGLQIYQVERNDQQSKNG